MKTRITFKLDSETGVSVIRDGKTIGNIWSESGKETLPYPHDEKSQACQNSIQICGFDKMSEVWACGIFRGHKDCVVTFLPTDDEYYREKLKRYAEYVQRFTETETDMTKLQNFADWHLHHF